MSEPRTRHSVPDELRHRIDELNEEAWALRPGDRALAMERAAEARGLAERKGYWRGLGWSLLTLGYCASRDAEYAVAGEHLARALDIMIECADRSGEALARYEIGLVHHRLGEYPKALEMYRSSRELHREIGNREEEARAAAGIGLVQYLQGAYDQSLESHRESLEVYREIGDRVGEGEALGRIGLGYYARGEYAEALEHYRASLAIHQECGNRGGEAHVLGIIAGVYYVYGDYPMALEQMRASLSIYQEIGDHRSETNAFVNIGNLHHVMGEYPQALEHYHASLEIYRAIGDRRGEAHLLGNIGTVRMLIGEYPQALEHYRAGLGILSEIGDRNGEAIARANIGSVHTTLGEHHQALEHYHAGLRIDRELGDRRGEAMALANIGRALRELGEHDRSHRHHAAALDIFREIGERSGEAEVLINIASAHRQTGDLDAALRELSAAAETARAIGSRPLLSKAMLGLGRIHAAMERPDTAVASLVEALALAIELGDRTLEMEIRDLISEQYERLGDTGQALAHLRRHLELQREVLGEETRQKLHNLQTSLRIELAEREAEIERLRNVELKDAFEKLERAHDELKSAQAQLVQSEKMAGLGQLTAGIAHEINNPINFVSASVRPLRRDHAHLARTLERFAEELPPEKADALKLEYEVDDTFEELEQLLASIESGAARTTEIVAGLRSFSRLDEGGRKHVDIHDGLDATLAILSGSLGEGIELVREYGELPPVECYPGEINQVFMNILTNAIKAIEGTGRVTVRTEAGDASVIITIADTGCGMTPDVRSRIFEPFFTTRDVGEGKGLGLSIAWGIIEKHGGTIEVASAPGEGSAFMVRLRERMKDEG